MKRSKIAAGMDFLDEDLIVGAVDASASAGGVKANIWKRWAAIAAAFVIILSGALLTLGFMLGNNTAATVAIDVNPSLEIEVDNKSRVVKINALNEDAKTVIGNMDFKNVDLDVAMYAIIGSMLRHGYLTVEQNSVLVSVNANDTAEAEKLEKSISADIAALLELGNINASLITQTFDKKGKISEWAKENGISEAKATLIEKIVAAGIKRGDGTPYTKEELASLNVNELKLMYESKAITVEGIHSTGTASEGKLIGKEKALAIALAKAVLSESEIRALEIELDYDRRTGIMLYEVEFKHGAYEYEYEINSQSGEIVAEEIEKDD